MKRIIPIIVAIAMAGTTAHAGVITWGAAANSTAASDVSTAGSLVEAINGAGAGVGSIAVNGVTFTPSNGTLLSGSTFSAGLFAGTTGSATYDTLLDNVDFGGGAGSTSISIGGGSLTVGNVYEVQVWFTDDRGAANRVMTFGDGGGNNINLAGSATTTTGVPGQFATGTFTATGANQTLSMAPNSFGNSHITAYQVRELTGLSVTGQSNPDGLIEQHLFEPNRIARVQRDTVAAGNNERSLGQTFVAQTKSEIDGISVRAQGAKNFTGLTTSSLQIKFFDMNGGNDAGEPDGDNVLMATFTYDASSLSYADGDWLRFDFGTTLELMGGERYGFMIYWDSDDTDNTFDLRHTFIGGGAAGDVFAGGTLRTNTSTYNDASWTGADPWASTPALVSDLTFVVHGNVIPAPAALPAGLALVTLVAARRRR